MCNLCNLCKRARTRVDSLHVKAMLPADGVQGVALLQLQEARTGAARTYHVDPERLVRPGRNRDLLGTHSAGTP